MSKRVSQAVLFTESKVTTTARDSDARMILQVTLHCPRHSTLYFYAGRCTIRTIDTRYKPK